MRLFILQDSTTTLFLTFFSLLLCGALKKKTAIGTAVGSRCLNLRSALVLGGLFEFAGGVSLGYKVSDTLREKIVDADEFVGQEELYIVGMFAALIGKAISTAQEHPASIQGDDE